MDVDQISLRRVEERERSWGLDRWLLVVVLLGAWSVRVLPAASDRFHADEALYGYWGLLIGRGCDPWLTSSPAYKPPLLPYLIAGTQLLFSNTEFTVRLPGLAAGLLTVALVAALARALYGGRWGGLLAAIGVALSPYAILFSATAFTDPLMVMLGVAGCVAAARDRLAWAGLGVGLACAAKQTGVVWLPLALVLHGMRADRRWLRLLGTWALVVGGVFGWDLIRAGHGGVSFWQTGVIGYGGLRLIWPQALWPRLREWAALARYVFAISPVDGVLVLGGLALAWLAGHQRRTWGPDATLGRYTAASLTDLLIIAFVLVYFLVHWLLAFPVWDRYLLPLVPVVAVLLGRVLAVWIAWIGQFWPGKAGIAALLCAILLAGSLAAPAWHAADGCYPVGGEHWAYDGIEQMVDFLHEVPAGTVIYHHWLGWHYAYYLFDAPVYQSYWSSPAHLAWDVGTFWNENWRYIAFPAWESLDRTAHALADAGYGLTPVLETTRRDGTCSFKLYRIVALSEE